MWRDIFEPLITMPEDLEEWIVIILLWVCILAVAGLIFWGIISLLDYAFLPVQEGYGTVTEKVFEPAHTTTTMVYNVAFKMSIPQTHYYPDAWKLGIQIGDKSRYYYVSEGDYMRANISQQVGVKYSIGRIMGTLYIKNVIF